MTACRSRLCPIGRSGQAMSKRPSVPPAAASFSPSMREMLALLSKGEVQGTSFGATLHALKRRGLAEFYGRGPAARWRLTDRGRKVVSDGGW